MFFINNNLGVYPQPQPLAKNYFPDKNLDIENAHSEVLSFNEQSVINSNKRLPKKVLRRQQSENTFL